MKTFDSLSFRPLCLYVIVIAAIFSSCTKEISGSEQLHTATQRPERDQPQGLLLVKNNTPGPIRVTVNNKTNQHFIQPGGQDSTYGSPQSTANILVETVVTDPNGAPAGQQLIFQYKLTYPADKASVQKEVNVPANLFFVNVRNLSGAPANRLVVADAGTHAEVAADMEILNANAAVPCGYYPTSTLTANIIVSTGDNGAKTWNFNGVRLPGTPNQAITVTCN